MNEEPQWLTPCEIARQAKCSKEWVKEIAEMLSIKPLRVGPTRMRLFTQEEARMIRESARKGQTTRS